ncbi:MAG TPA: TMEM14 family protein [Chthoniobacteraceae bacterium]|nr:hypothetical protein [Chthoniobacter sp.]HEV7868759.1 TMEM14 family protein [Chthoniobacteraceae bacterium]
MLDLTKIYLFIFGALTIAGGVVGYLKAGSVQSIVAGGIAGALLLVSGYLIGSGKTQPGVILGLVLSLALLAQFLPKYLDAHKFMPAGMMTILSAIGLVMTVLALIKK